MKAIAIPLCLAAVFGAIAAAALLKRAAPAAPAIGRAPVQASKPATRGAQPVAYGSRPSTYPTKSDGTEDLGRINEDMRIKSTYQSYRMAVASGNAHVEKALLPVLLRDRKTALAFAQEDLAGGSDDGGAIQKVIEALGR